jgi:hypothetical protein
MYKKALYQVLPIAFILVAINSIAGESTLPITDELIWWPLQALILFAFWLYKTNIFDSKNEESMLVIRIFLWWMIFNCVRGFFVAEGYWDYKGLVDNTMVFLIPLVAYASTDMKLVQRMLRYFVKYGIPIFLLFIPFVSGRAFGFYLAPVGLLLLFTPALRNRWKIVIITLALGSILLALGDRKNIMKFGVPFLLIAIFYGQQLISKGILNTARLALIIAPIIFFVLGTTGTFNVFNMDQYMEGGTITFKNKDGSINEGNLTDDTRTFIYREVLQTAQKYDSWLIGRSMAKGYESPFFEDRLVADYRLRSETAIPNIFTYSGLIGVLLYAIVFYRASFLAVRRSNNIYSKMLGIFIAVIWCYSWVGYATFFRMPYLLNWMMIGMCFSRSFRAMTDSEVKYWARGIFDYRYAKAWNFLSEQNKERG